MKSSSHHTYPPAHRTLALVGVVALVFAVIFTLQFSVSQSAPLPRDGEFVRVGVGYSPVAKTESRTNDQTLSESGASVSIIGGIVWDRTHSLELRWQNIFLADGTDGSQGVFAFIYTRYLAQRGPAPYFSLGIGLQHGPFLGPADRKSRTDAGAAVTLGAGLRFTRKLDIGLDYSFGSTNRFFDNNISFDYTHQQLIFSLRYTLLGG